MRAAVTCLHLIMIASIADNSDWLNADNNNGERSRASAAVWNIIEHRV